MIAELLYYAQVMQWFWKDNDKMGELVFGGEDPGI